MCVLDRQPQVTLDLHSRCSTSSLLYNIRINWWTYEDLRAFALCIARRPTLRMKHLKPEPYKPSLGFRFKKTTTSRYAEKPCHGHENAGATCYLQANVGTSVQ